jgi:phosphoribosylaminoimidazole (AIR) synthetase
MGVGMVAVVDSAMTVRAQGALQRAGVKSHRLGEIARPKGKPKVRVKGPDFEIALS